MIRLLTILLLSSAALSAAEVSSASSTRGAKVFVDKGCADCHALNGVGPRIGPDLGRMADRGFTPASFAATIWNHAPLMWEEIRRRGMERREISEQQAADLFAFFYSLRFFEEPGDGARGKALFSARRCAICHGVTDEKLAGAKPVLRWTATADPVELVETMWSHSKNMQDEMERRRVRLPQLSGQELADILVYTRHAANRTPAPGVFDSGSPEEGRRLFESKRCSDCHGDIARFLTMGLKGQTLTDIAAAMWNHGIDMSLNRTAFGPGEMRRIADFIWFARTVEGVGETGRGARVWAEKKCALCHDDPASGAPALSAFSTGGRFFSGVAMVSALASHGPGMLERMRGKEMGWPRFSSDDMSRLIAYLNTRTPSIGRRQ